ncbi:DUF3067 family protein [Cyanobium sp. WAJ14-Wanaka]|uniref:DUF3067 family protein n=1 Tax=Cyanobium sp. WAJ14-Wanaka TaxID=2823725 RepID=UPI0020CEBED3|nr:DUF3067 family protein [Cyanobium sp. WAJ14-Wanaka]MCP9774162.1 DUF3067 family protein [Cyanobium sp. WAJ14-Wanaka]
MLLCNCRAIAPSPLPPFGPAIPFEGSQERSESPLSVADLLAVLRQRWQRSYDLQLVQRRGRFYFQVMWAYLEQQSFPMAEAAYLAKLEELVGLLNGLGVADQVRHWLCTTSDKPRLGRAMNLPLEIDPGRASEFVL